MSLDSMLEEKNKLPLALLLFGIPIAIALLSMILANQLTLQSPSRDQDAPHCKDLTFRVEGLPINISRRDIQEQLRSIKHEARKNPKNDLESLVVRSLARRDARSRSATVVVNTSLSPADLLKDLRRALTGAGLSYRCDCDFYGVTPLQDGSSKTSICDVIAVPGLASHPLGSWKSRESSDVWLRDWLPDDLPNVRTLLYGYDTQLLKNDSVSSIEDLGRAFFESLRSFRKKTSTEDRPIIFIGHSLGGLLIKEALTYSHKSTKINNGHGPPIDGKCCGILFFGVPHLGLRNEVLSTIVAGRPNQALINSIVVDNESEPSHFLRRISDDFARCFQGETRVVSFYERKLSHTVEMQNEHLTRTGPMLLMVTEKSATSTGVTGASEEDKVVVDTDHSDIVKFKSVNEDIYGIARDRIERFVFKAFESVGGNDIGRDVSPNTENHFTASQGGSIFSGPVSVSGWGTSSQGNYLNISRNSRT